MNRNKYMPLIAFLGIILLLYIVVSAFRYIRIFIVFSSGLGPFLIVFGIILLIVVLFIKGFK
ncbi:hypothetical protein [Sutcliffiella halmapala]|uniref:hypothetical protein n=1 Tax=Sutcliffiella halmapala TaxID=79882 RepID=UPI001116D6C4|nr:hypothetical protein [Sutcliffiella halmapala]